MLFFHHLQMGDGRLILNDDALHDPLRVRIIDAFYALHTGEIFGLAGRTTALIGGAGLLAIMLFGLSLWCVRRARSS